MISKLNFAKLAFFVLASSFACEAFAVQTSPNGQHGKADPQKAPLSSSTPAKVDVVNLVVMDPLSSKLACDCVQGYAQRDYEKLALHISRGVKMPVNVVFAESVAEALSESKGKADLFIGKHSVVLAGAKEAKLSVSPILKLTDKNDSTVQTGLLVVRKGNPAKTVADLKGYRVLYGPASCDEKYSAPMALLKKHGIEVKEPPASDICSACSVAAKELMQMSDSEKAVAVISSYAQPLLEGCGNIQKGDLRVVGESAPVPFVTAFVNDSLTAEQKKVLTQSLEDVALDPDLMTIMETGTGFEPWTESESKSDSAPSSPKKSPSGPPKADSGSKKN